MGVLSPFYYKKKNYKIGWQVELVFSINLNEKDIALLKQIQNLFRVGTINYDKKNPTFHFRIGSTKDLKIIIDHFDKYPLITQKRADF